MKVKFTKVKPKYKLILSSLIKFKKIYFQNLKTINFNIKKIEVVIVTYIKI
jgi:hypothetical protein